MAISVLALALAAGVLRTGLLPRWYGLLIIAFGVWLAVTTINYLAMYALTLWIPVIAALLLIASRTARGEPRSGVAAAA